MLGWMCHSIFAARKWKQHYGDWVLATGTAGMAEILNCSNFDIVATRTTTAIAGSASASIPKASATRPCCTAS